MKYKARQILFPNFLICSVTPCMLTMTLLPERMMVHVHYHAMGYGTAILPFIGKKKNPSLFSSAVLRTITKLEVTDSQKTHCFYFLFGCCRFVACFLNFEKLSCKELLNVFFFFQLGLLLNLFLFSSLFLRLSYL